MTTITLTTDLGLVDSYVASIKGAILKSNQEVIIIDITHNVPPFDFQKAAFILRNCYKDFPEGTIHIIGVNSETDVNNPHIALYANGHYFIGADNGVFSLIFDNPPEKVVELTISQDTDRITFPTKDIFVKAACHIARGGTLEIIGNTKYELVVKSLFRAISEKNSIKGIATYIDHYGNLITNISEDEFKNVGKNRAFKILFRGHDYQINKISLAYSSVLEGERVAIFSATGYIEIAINKASASKLFGINQDDTIRIEFYD